MKLAATLAALGLAVTIVGCRSDTPTSQTSLTSAEEPRPQDAREPAGAGPQEPRPTPAPAPGLPTKPARQPVERTDRDRITVTDDDRAHARAANQTWLEQQRDAGVTESPRLPARPGEPELDGGAAPGHVIWPPGNATGTGAPTSDGSHDIGSR